MSASDVAAGCSEVHMTSLWRSRVQLLGCLLSLWTLTSLAVGCGAESAQAAESPTLLDAPALSVRLAEVERGTLDLPVHASGTLGARHELELSFKVPGV